MAKLTDLKRTAELTIRRTLDNEDFLLWCNELYGELSEISKQEELPLEVEIRAEDYDLEIEVEGKTETLKVTENSIELPSNFQQIIKVEGDVGERRYLFYQRSLGDEEITTANNYPNHANEPYSNKSNLFFIDHTQNKIYFKSNLVSSGSNITIRLYYYKTLPLYDVDEDKDRLGSLTIPFDRNYHKVISYYVIMKYFETWQDLESVATYKMEYLRVRTEYESAALRRHQESETTIQQKEAYWK